ncbi:MAG: hypothetical protein DME32_11750 [Verrucomicrobia bacterium]|nr:MAG: hypothetical protein DME32_11750 [Verrucomicrobiota bacterium]
MRLAKGAQAKPVRPFCSVRGELRHRGTRCHTIVTVKALTLDSTRRDFLVTRYGTTNAAARDRCIYIHGTPEERNIGKAASFGCIRMRSRDIMALYDRVHVGMHVTVSEKPLEELVPGEKPTLLSRAD